MNYIFLIAICYFCIIKFFNDKEDLENEEIPFVSNIDSDLLKLNQDNYKKVWINPEKYDTINDFLVDFKSFTWVYINPLEEDFVIWKSFDDWSVEYIQFKQEDIKSELFSNEKNKNLAILDIYSAYKDAKIYWSVWSKYWQRIIFESDVRHPETLTLNKVFSMETNINKVIWELKKINNKSKSDYELLSYSYDFTGDYGEAKSTRNLISDYSDPDCLIKTDVKVAWIVFDQNNKPIKWAKISLLNDQNIYTF